MNSCQKTALFQCGQLAIGSLITHWKPFFIPLLSTRKQNGEGNGNPLQYSCLENPMDGGAWYAVVRGVAKSLTRLSDFPFTFHFHTLEKEMATHSSVLAWRIPGTVEPCGLLSMGLHRVGHDWSDLAAAAAVGSKTLITPVSLQLPFRVGQDIEFWPVECRRIPQDLPREWNVRISWK